MSTSFGTSTFIIKPEDIPNSLYNIFDDLTKHCNFLASSRCNDPKQLNYVAGSSRNGWALWTLSDILSKFEANYLLFLVGKNVRYRIEDRQYGRFEQITFLEESEFIQNVIKEIDFFFTWSLNNIDEISNISGLYSDDEIKEIITKTNVSDFPQIDFKSQQDDEGDNIDYLFTYLRSIRSVFEYALCYGFIVAHKEDGEFSLPD